MISTSQVLFETGTSGFQLETQFSNNDGSTLIGILPSYTANGKVSFGIGIGFESNDVLDVNSTSVRPLISYLPIRQGENDMPISVAVTGSYQYNTFPDFDFTGNSFGISMDIYHEIVASRNLKIFPAGSVGWSRTTFNSNTVLEDYTGIGYGLQATLLFARKFYVAPTLFLSEGDSNFVLTMGLLFPS